MGQLNVREKKGSSRERVRVCVCLCVCVCVCVRACVRASSKIAGEREGLLFWIVVFDMCICASLLYWQKRMYDNS